MHHFSFDKLVAPVCLFLQTRNASRGLLQIVWKMVPQAGLEPARLSTTDFESAASTNFATGAAKGR